MRTLFLMIALLALPYVYAQEIDSVLFENTKKNNINFLRKLVRVKAGAAIDSLILEEDVKKLKRLAGVSHASYKVEGGNVIYTVEENHTLIPAVNIWSVDNVFSYKIGLYDYNWFGRNITFGGFYQYNGESSYGINFWAPYLFSNRFGLAVNYQNWSSKEPFYYQDLTTEATNYTFRNNSIEALGAYEFDFKNNIRLGVNIGKDTYTYRSGFNDVLVPEKVEISKVTIKGLYEYNNLNFNYQYVSGIKNVLNLQQVFTDNEVQPSFIVGWNDFSYFKRVGGKGNWANRLRVGLSTNSSSVFAPFAVDNNVNIRGVGNLIDRGTGSIVLNSEYRYTLYEKGWFAAQGNVFVDAGTWRKPGGELDDFLESNNGQLYTGLGFRLIHKRIFNAIFRLDYGYSFENNSGGIVFGIGQYF